MFTPKNWCDKFAPKTLHGLLSEKQVSNPKRKKPRKSMTYEANVLVGGAGFEPATPAV